MYTQILIALSAGAVLANGEFKDSERLAIGVAAQSFQVNAQDLLAAIDAEIIKQKELSPDALKAYFVDITKDITIEEALPIFEMCIVIVLADNELSKEEAELLINFADILKINLKYAIQLIALYATKNQKLNVEFKL